MDRRTHERMGGCGRTNGRTDGLTFIDLCCCTRGAGKMTLTKTNTKKRLDALFFSSIIAAAAAAVAAEAPAAAAAAAKIV